MDAIQNERLRVKIVSWPSPQDYNEAIQNLEHSMLDTVLRAGSAELNALGLPKPTTGAFASVYRVSTGSDDWALRCFLHNRPDQQERYRLLAEHFESLDAVDCIVPFEFLESGISVHGRVLPILKMNWVGGEQLIQCIEANLSEPQILDSIRNQFGNGVLELRRHGIAHGDLQHGNIIVRGERLSFVDYDGMYVPSLEQLGSLELGHRNYQHPQRSHHDFGPWLDNFPAWVIHCSLTCLMHDPNLWNVLSGGDECLLFRREDFVTPLKSRAFYTLENHENEEVRASARFLRSLLDCDLPSIPYLGEAQSPLTELLPVERPAEPLRKASVKSGDWIQDWVDADDESEMPSHAHTFTPPPASSRRRKRKLKLKRWLASIIHSPSSKRNWKARKKLNPALKVILYATVLGFSTQWIQAGLQSFAAAIMVSSYFAKTIKHSDVERKRSLDKLENLAQTLDHEKIAGLAQSAQITAAAVGHATQSEKLLRTETFGAAIEDLRKAGKDSQSKILESKLADPMAPGVSQVGKAYLEMAEALELKGFKKESDDFYAKAAKDLVNEQVVDADSIKAFTKASIYFLQSRSMAEFSQFNNKLCLLLKSNEDKIHPSKGKEEPPSKDLLKELRLIYESNAKVIDEMLKTVL